MINCACFFGGTVNITCLWLEKFSLAKSHRETFWTKKLLLCNTGVSKILLNCLFSTPWAGAFDPKGLLRSLTSVVQVFLGYQAGHTLTTYQVHKDRLARWVIWGSVTGLLVTISILSTSLLAPWGPMLSSNPRPYGAPHSGSSLHLYCTGRKYLSLFDYCTGGKIHIYGSKHNKVKDVLKLTKSNLEISQNGFTPPPPPLQHTFSGNK